jgi:hypothetical protein
MRSSGWDDATEGNTGIEHSFLERPGIVMDSFAASKPPSSHGRRVDGDSRRHWGDSRISGGGVCQRSLPFPRSLGHCDRPRCLYQGQ